MGRKPSAFVTAEELEELGYTEEDAEACGFFDSSQEIPGLSSDNGDEDMGEDEDVGEDEDMGVDEDFMAVYEEGDEEEAWDEDEDEGEDEDEDEDAYEDSDDKPPEDEAEAARILSALAAEEYEEEFDFDSMPVEKALNLIRFTTPLPNPQIRVADSSFGGMRVVGPGLPSERHNPGHRQLLLWHACGRAEPPL